MPYSLRNLSIQKKLVVSMAVCLMAFMLISGGLGAWLIGNAVRDRVVNEDLPTAVRAIATDIERRIGEPLTAARGIASNSYVQSLEEQGVPDAGLADWKAYAQSLKLSEHAASIFWVSKETGKYLTEEGASRQITAKDTWFTDFLASGKPYTLDIDSMAKAIGSVKLAETGHAFLVRGNGNILIHPDASLADGKHPMKELPGIDEATVHALLGGQNFAQARIVANGESQFIASSFIPELGAYVIAEVPEDEMLGPVNRAIRLATLVAALVGGAISLFVIVLVSRAIARPVQRAATLLGEIADGQGDLTRRMKVESNDEIGQLASSFNRFVSSLSELVRQVRASGESIATGSSEISDGNHDLSQRTEEQASNLQQTAASMEQLTVTVRHNADNALAAAQIVSGAADSAARGSTVVRSVVDTMNEITASSKQIADIVAVVDGIAFQTNILALNAAVEAARAGEEGRGFAVVAGEVRTLAQRSATAAREIKQLIARSVESVESGAVQVTQAGQAMDDIVAQVGRVNDLVGEISAASKEQSQGIGQVGDAVTQLDQVTQQNAALVEESAAAAESLKHQAARLAELMSAFTVDEDAGA